MKEIEPPTDQPGQELPPFVKTWKQFYRLLIGWLVFLILIFYAFTKYFE
jgi:hypothetical protein